MPVNINSVISTRINTFDSALYTAITDKEDYAYTAAPGNLAIYQPMFTTLNSTIISWMDINRETLINDFITALYSKIVIENLYSSNPLPSSADSRNIFTMGVYRARIKTDPINYYTDYIPPVIPNPAQFPHLEADISLISSLVSNYNSGTEKSTLLSLTSSYRGVIAPYVNQLLFEDLAFVNPAKSKVTLGNDIFVTLHWKEVYQALNVGSLTLPPYI